MSPQDQSLTAIPGGKAAVRSEQLQTTCARPGCTELFLQSTTRGRPKLFCGDDCRQQAHHDRRVLRRRLRHYEEQVRYLRTQMAAFERSATDPDDRYDEHAKHALSPAVLRGAEDAVLQVRTLTRFLTPDSGEYAADLLGLFRAVEPVIEFLRRSDH